jgi:HK97 family phage major capsid protein
MKKVVCAYRVSQTVGALTEGEVVHLDSEKAQPLVDAGFLTEASEDDIGGGDTADDSMAQEAAVQRSIEEAVAKATEKAIAKITKSKNALTIPAETKSEPAFKSLGHFAYGIWKAGKGDNTYRNRLDAHQTEIRQKTPLGQNEGTNADGGYDVKPEWYSEVWDKTHEYPKLIERCNVVPAGSNTYNIPAINETSMADGSRHGGILAYYVGEGAPATASKVALTQVTASLLSLVILNYVTNQLLQDANIEAIDKVLNKKVVLEMLWQQNQGIVAGAGTTQPVGILNQPALITVTKSSHDSNAQIGFDDLTAMDRAMYSGCRANAVWLVTPEARAQFQGMAFQNVGGTYPAAGLTYSIHDEYPMRIFGRPVIEVPNLPQLGAVGDVIFADLSQLVVYERAGLQFDISTELQFTTLQTAYRTVYRFDVRSPWTSAISSVDGYYSYSPFVALQSRGT